MVDIAFPFDWPERLAWLVALACVLIGLGLMLFPNSFLRLISLSPVAGSPNGVSEIRGPFGGMMVGLGLACIILAQPFTYFALGLALLFAVIGRLISFAIDRSFNVHCIAATVFEAVCASFTLRFALIEFGLV